MPNQQYTVLQTVTVYRDGLAHNPTIGQPFEFSASELKDIRRAEAADGIVRIRDIEVDPGIDPTDKAAVKADTAELATANKVAGKA